MILAVFEVLNTAKIMHSTLGWGWVYRTRTDVVAEAFSSVALPL